MSDTHWLEPVDGTTVVVAVEDEFRVIWRDDARAHRRSRLSFGVAPCLTPPGVAQDQPYTAWA